MLQYLILENKPNIEISNEIGIDLLHKTLNHNDIINRNGSFIYVNEYYVARPDLISLAVYGDDKYADIICKINGISNPFELNENNVLFIPTFEYINSILNKTDKNSTTTIIKDNSTIALSNKIGDQKEKNEKRSPSQQIVGDTNYVIDKSLGVVFY